jgi:DNA excision repair protein ERCC-4
VLEIIVDDREAASGVFEHLQAVADISVAIQRLPLGDYAVNDILLFERKTLLDFVASLKEGRLFHQACRLAAATEHTVMILEGTAADLATSRIRREAIQGALIQLTLFLGIPLLRARDAQESANLMLYAARQARIFIGDAAVTRRFAGRRPKAKRKAQLHVLQGLPGVGPARAKALLERFGSVEAALSAGLEELTQVEGVGTQTAATIRWAVSEETPAYPYSPEDL